MSDTRELQYHINVVAKRLIINAVDWAANHDREMYPEIGDYDWNAVCRQADKFVNSLTVPTNATFVESYGYLEQRANEFSEATP